MTHTMNWTSDSVALYNTWKGWQCAFKVFPVPSFLVLRSTLCQCPVSFLPIPAHCFDLSFPAQPGCCCHLRFPLPPSPLAKNKPFFFSLCVVWRMTAYKIYITVLLGKSWEAAEADLWMPLVSVLFVLVHAFIPVISCVQDSHVPYNLLLKHSYAHALTVSLSSCILLWSPMQLSFLLSWYLVSPSVSERNPCAAISQASTLSLISFCCLIQEKRKKDWIMNCSRRLLIIKIKEMGCKWHITCYRSVVSKSVKH